MKTQSISRRALASGLALAPLAPAVAFASEPHCDAELIELDVALVRAWAIQDRSEAGHDPSRDLDLEAAMAACLALAERIHAIPARTLDGLRAKCRALHWCCSSEFDGLAPDPGETFIVNRTTALVLCNSILHDLIEITLKA